MSRIVGALKRQRHTALAFIIVAWLSWAPSGVAAQSPTPAIEVIGTNGTKSNTESGNSRRAELEQLAAEARIKEGRIGPVTAAVLLALGRLHQAQGNKEQAIRNFQEVVEAETGQRIEDYQLRADAAAESAKLLFNLGRFGPALHMIVQVQVSLPLDSADPRMLDLQNTRASIYLALAEDRDAEIVYRSLVRLYDTHPRLNRGERAQLLNNLAYVLNRQGKAEEALHLQREVVAYRIKHDGQMDFRTLAASGSLAGYLGGNGRVNEAIVLHRKILSARRSAAVYDPVGIASSLHNLGYSLEERGDKKEAQRLLHEALALRLKWLGPRHPDTITTLRQLTGLEFFSLGNEEAAYELSQTTIHSIETSLRSIPLSARKRRDYFASLAQAYKFASFLSVRKGRVLEAMAIGDSARSKTLAEEIEASSLIDRSATVEELTALRVAQNILAQLSTERIDELAPDKQTQLLAALDAAEIEFESVSSRIRKHSPDIEGDGLKASELLGSLPSNSSFIQYTMVGDAIQLIWLSKDGSGSARPALKVEGLRETIKAYLALLASPVTGSGPGTALADKQVYAWPDGSFRLRSIFDEVPASAKIVSSPEGLRVFLSDALLGPLPPKVRAAQQWIISPDSEISAIPFDSLTLDGHYVAETKQVSVMPSIRILGLLNRRRAELANAPRSDLLAIGDPAYQSAPAGSEAARWPELKGTGLEMGALAKLFGLQSGNNLFSRSQASEATIRALDQDGRLQRFRMIMIAAHGSANLKQPELSSVYLLGDSGGPSTDGRLNAAELATLRIASDLVVLSACETGVGDWKDGEGILGLPYALMVAGTQAAVLSNWPISDGGSAALMEHLFAGIKQGQTPLAALTDAKRLFLSGMVGQKYADPAYWAAFTFYGLR